mmetsp:Transcript_10618/g.35318  ORF Transcript_10618/g.35318 Transcript_10618/m.35318 type:complete len:585 (-) Transcript_10618:373-2127(-)
MREHTPNSELSPTTVGRLDRLYRTAHARHARLRKAPHAPRLRAAFGRTLGRHGIPLGRHLKGPVAPRVLEDVRRELRRVVRLLRALVAADHRAGVAQAHAQQPHVVVWLERRAQLAGAPPRRQHEPRAFRARHEGVPRAAALGREGGGGERRGEHRRRNLHRDRRLAGGRGAEGGGGVADARVRAELAEPVPPPEGEAVLPRPIRPVGLHPSLGAAHAAWDRSVQKGGVDDVVERADEGERLRLGGGGDGALVEPVPKLVAVAPERRQHDGAVEGAGEGEAVREPLPHPLEVRHVLPSARVQVLEADPRLARREGRVLLEHEVARTSDVLLLLVHEPHAPVAEALPLAERVVRRVAELVRRVHRHRPRRRRRLQLLHKEGMAARHGGDREGADVDVPRHVGQADVEDAARALRGAAACHHRRVAGAARLGVLPSNPQLVVPPLGLVRAAPRLAELLEVRPLRVAHPPPVPAPVAVDQVVEGRLVLLVLLPHLKAHLPLRHRRDPVWRRAHREHARVLVDRVVVAAGVPDRHVEYRVHAVARHEQVRRRKVLKPRHLPVKHRQRRRRPDAVNVREDDVDAHAQHR